jgi:hypothetical protein
MIYTVFKVLSHNGKQLLLVQDKGTHEFSLCVYDEHNESTLMRLCCPSLEEFERAIEIIKGE